jgi:hypothetical protein
VHVGRHACIEEGVDRGAARQQATLAALGLPLAAGAEEAAVPAEAAAEPTGAFYAVALVPIVTYGLFWVYRERVNP